MTDDRITAARAGLPEWTAQAERTFLSLAETLGAPIAESRRDPIVLLPYLETYLSGLPLDELDEDDWGALRTQFVAYVAQSLIIRYGAEWSVADDDRSPVRFRYVLERGDPAGERRWVDPFAVVMNEFRARPVEVSRMLATAELALGVGHPQWS